ncbi:MAG: dual specificity protein phosphatase family protein [Proteobacteria bacterium]|nr:dual specificity protein phosphatase family protein [Pseudomonadota bacterium]
MNMIKGIFCKVNLIAMILLSTAVSLNSTLALSNTQVDSPEVSLAQVALQTQEIDTFEFAQGLLRGARPANEPQVRYLAEALDVTLIVSLDDYWKDPSMKARETTWVKSAGIQIVHLPMHHLKGPTLREVKQALSVLKSNPQHKIYLHCQHGKDRTGIVVAAYRIIYEGVEVDDAIKEMYRFGHSPFLAFWDRLLFKL